MWHVSKKKGPPAGLGGRRGQVLPSVSPAGWSPPAQAPEADVEAPLG